MAARSQATEDSVAAYQNFSYGSPGAPAGRMGRVHDAPDSLHIPVASIAKPLAGRAK